LTNWAQVSSGGACIASVKTDGTIWAWGINLNGRLGDNTVIERSSPVQIGALTNWSKVSAGNNSISAIKADGTMWGWGRNNNGQIGDNTIADRSSPVQIGALTDWIQTATGWFFTVALRGVV